MGENDSSTSAIVPLARRDARWGSWCTTCCPCQSWRGGWRNATSQRTDVATSWSNDTRVLCIYTTPSVTPWTPNQVIHRLGSTDSLINNLIIKHVIYLIRSNIMHNNHSCASNQCFLKDLLIEIWSFSSFPAFFISYYSFPCGFTFYSNWKVVNLFLHIKFQKISCNWVRNSTVLRACSVSATGTIKVMYLHFLSSTSWRYCQGGGDQWEDQESAAGESPTCTCETAWIVCASEYCFDERQFPCWRMVSAKRGSEHGVRKCS